MSRLEKPCIESEFQINLPEKLRDLQEKSAVKVPYK